MTSQSETFPDTPPDWQDNHEGPHSREVNTAREAYETGFSRLPHWAELALSLHNRVVGVMGLKTEGENGADLMTTLPVLEESRDLYRVGLVDKHLTFPITTEITQNRMRVNTAIWFNHWLGRVYLAVVLIPHKLIARQVIARMA